MHRHSLESLLNLAWAVSVLFEAGLSRDSEVSIYCGFVFRATRPTWYASRARFFEASEEVPL